MLITMFLKAQESPKALLIRFLDLVATKAVSIADIETRGRPIKIGTEKVHYFTGT